MSKARVLREPVARMLMEMAQKIIIAEMEPIMIIRDFMK